MIEVTTMLAMEATGFDRDFVSDKRVVLSMSIDDAKAMATVLLNTETESPEWNGALSHLAVQLIQAVNKCR